MNHQQFVKGRRTRTLPSPANLHRSNPPTYNFCVRNSAAETSGVSSPVERGKTIPGLRFHGDVQGVYGISFEAKTLLVVDLPCRLANGSRGLTKTPRPGATHIGQNCSRRAKTGRTFLWEWKNHHLRARFRNDGTQGGRRRHARKPRAQRRFQMLSISPEAGTRFEKDSP